MIPLLVDAEYVPDGWLGFLLGDNKPIDFCGEVGTDDALFEAQMMQLCHTLGEFTSHSIDGPAQKGKAKVDAPKGWGGLRNKMMKFNRADIIGKGSALPAQSESKFSAMEMVN
jgi:hypothetical protein